VNWREKLFQRNPLRRELAPVADVGNARRLFAPPMHAGGFFYIEVPAAALVAGGGFYTPPVGGAVVTAVHFGTDAGVVSAARLGLFDADAWQLENWGEVGATTNCPIWRERPLKGTVTPIQALGVGDLAAMGAIPIAQQVEIQVMPGSVFVFLSTLANTLAEHAIYVHEHFTDGDMNA